MKRPRAAAGGFSITELLVVLAIIGLTVAVTVPLVSNQVRMAAIRSAAAEFTSNLRAARMIAVSGHRTIDVRVDADPANSYTYKDVRGVDRQIALPDGIRIVSCTPATIRFRPDGSVPGGAVTIFEARGVSGAAERWTVETNDLGILRTVYARAD